MGLKLEIKNIIKIQKSICIIEIDSNIRAISFFIKVLDKYHFLITSLDFCENQSNIFKSRTFWVDNINIIINNGKKFNIKFNNRLIKRIKNYTIIQILDDDIIKKEVEFLLCDSFKGMEYYRYIYKDIFIFDYSLNGNKRIFSGKILEINNSNFQFESGITIYNDYYSCIPIILVENFTNIGLFLSMNNKFNNINIGEFIGIIETNIISNFDNMNKNIINTNNSKIRNKSSDKINIFFVCNKKSLSTMISTPKNNTIKNLLEMYCEKVKINYKYYFFFYNGITLNSKSVETLEKYQNLARIKVIEKMQTIGAK